MHIIPELLARDPLQPDAVPTDAVQRVFDAVDPDIIHIHNIPEPSVIEAATRRAPTVRTIHDHNAVCPAFNKTFANGAICTKSMGTACVSQLALEGGCLCIGKHPAGLMNAIARKERENRAMDDMHAILVTTDFMRRQLLDVGHAGAHVTTLPLPVGAPLARASLNGHEVGTIVWAGRMILPDKGLDVLLEAVTHMRADFRLVLAGDGPHKDYLRTKSHELGIADKVSFPGWLRGDALARMYESAHAAVVPSMWAEPYGLLGLEAMSYGVPVVAFDVGGVRQWLADKETGYLVPRAHMPLLALRLEMLLNDYDLRRRLGEAARQRVAQEFTVEAHMAALDQVYNSALA